VPYFLEDEAAHENFAPGVGLALAQLVDGASAGIDALLTQLELRQFLLQRRDLFIEFGHVSRPSSLSGKSLISGTITVLLIR